VSVETVIGRRLAVAGAAAQAAGLGIDAWRHAQDPTLAAREALLSFTNAGHMLLLGGIALVLVGATLTLLGPRLRRAPRGLRLALPVVIALAVGASSAAAANSSLSRGHDHGAADNDAPHSHGGEGPSGSAAMGRTERHRLAAQLSQARDVADRYATVADAERAGYRAVTPYLPLIGAHYIRALVVDGTFDITQPEMLLYDGTKPTSRIVGLSYYITTDREPPGFAGPNDRWHRHIGLCIDTKRAFVVGDEQTTAAQCARRGGIKVDGRTGWMVHAWVVPGWESTLGVFSAENPQLH
jgi:hypothetical protein